MNPKILGLILVLAGCLQLAASVFFLRGEDNITYAYSLTAPKLPGADPVTPAVAGVSTTDNGSDLSLIESQLILLRNQISSLAGQINIWQSQAPAGNVIDIPSSAQAAILDPANDSCSGLARRLSLLERQLDSDRGNFSLGQMTELPQDVSAETFANDSNAFRVDEDGNVTIHDLNASGDATITGNLTVAGSQAYSGVMEITASLEDPLVEISQGGGGYALLADSISLKGSAISTTTAGTNLVLNPAGNILFYNSGNTLDTNGNLSLSGLLHLSRSSVPDTIVDRLYNVGGNLYWNGSNLTGGGVLPGGSEGQLLYNNAGSWTAFSGMHWDDANGRLGIGTTAPAQKLEVAGNVALPATTAGVADGVIYKGAASFIHNYSIPSTYGANTFLGDSAGSFTLSRSSNSSASYNTGVGRSALGALTTGYYNTAVGAYALSDTATGTYNTAIGADALSHVTTGSQNVSVGARANSFNTTGLRNVAIGTFALDSNETGSYNAMIGAFAGELNTTGSYNVALGDVALDWNTTGSNNTALGYGALRSAWPTSASNTAVGYKAGHGNNEDGYASANNSFFGYQSGLNIRTGSNNLFLGYGSGDNVTTGSNNIVIGYNIDAPAATSANILNIGNLIFGTGINGTGTTLSTGNIGIGVVTPTGALHLKAGTAAASTAPLKFTAGVNLTAPESGTMEFDGTNLYFTPAAARKTIAFLENPSFTTPALGNATATQLTVPTVIGGSATTADLILQTTSGIGEAGADMHFLVGNNGGTEAMTILNNGRIGIGTTAPATLLHIATNDTSINGYATQKNEVANNTYHLGPRIDFLRKRGTLAAPAAVSPGDYLGMLNFQSYNGTSYGGAGNIMMYASASTGGGDMYFGTSPSGSSNTNDRMAIMNNGDIYLAGIENGASNATMFLGSGNVGIGTINPAQKLSVWGNQEIVNSATVGGETLANGALTGGSSWAVTNDCSLASDKATWVYSSGAASTLTQSAATLATAGVGSRWYKLVYTVSGRVGWPTASVVAPFAGTSVSLDIYNGTWTTYFKSAAAPTDFVITATLSAGQSFTLDDISLKEVQGGDLMAYGLITGGGTSGIKVLSNGSVGIGTASPSSKLAIKGENSVASIDNTNLVVNGTFDTDLSGWTAGAGWSWNAAGKASYASGADAYLQQNISLEEGKKYIYEFEILDDASNYSFSVWIGDTFIKDFYGNGVHSFGYTATATGPIALKILGWTSYPAGSVDNVRVREIATNTDSLISLLNSDGAVGIEIRSGGSGLHNTAIGHSALATNITGNDSAAIGYKVLENNIDGYSNAAVGAYALGLNTGGYENAAVGAYALNSNVSGNDNVAVGVSSLYFNVSGYGNTAIGAYALDRNSTGSINSANGYLALYNNTTGASNVAQGYGAAYANTTGSNNVAIGRGSLNSNTTASGNIAVGYYALRYNQTGTGNVVIGQEAGRGASNNSYSGNSLFGYRSGYALSTGSNNILLGYQSGDNLTTGANNIVIGYNIDAPAAASANILNIGNLIYGTAIDGTGTTLSTGNVGIGITAPLSKLHVEGSNAGGTATDPASFIAYINNSNNGISANGLLINLTTGSPGSDNQWIEFTANGVEKGAIEGNGGNVNYWSVSDARFKTNVIDTPLSLDDLMKIRVRDFEWNDSGLPGTGFIAQELYGIYPAAVYKGDDGEEITRAWKVDYGKLTPLLVKAIQDQQAQIDGLKLVLSPDGSLGSNSTSTTEVARENSGFLTFVKNALASLGLALQDGVAKLTEIFVDKVSTKNITTQEMCVSGNDGETICVDKDQLKSLLETVGVSKTTIRVYENESEETDPGSSTSTLPIEEQNNENTGIIK